MLIRKPNNEKFLHLLLKRGQRAHSTAGACEEGRGIGERSVSPLGRPSPWFLHPLIVSDATRGTYVLPEDQQATDVTEEGAEPPEVTFCSEQLVFPVHHVTTCSVSLSTLDYPVCTDWTLWPRSFSWHHVFFEKMESTLTTFYMFKPQMMYILIWVLYGSSSVCVFLGFLIGPPLPLSLSFFFLRRLLIKMVACLRGVSPRRR